MLVDESDAYRRGGAHRRSLLLGAFGARPVHGLASAHHLVLSASSPHGRVLFLTFVRLFRVFPTCCSLSPPQKGRGEARRGKGRLRLFSEGSPQDRRADGHSHIHLLPPGAKGLDPGGQGHSRQDRVRPLTDPRPRLTASRKTEPLKSSCSVIKKVRC